MNTSKEMFWYVLAFLSSIVGAGCANQTATPDDEEVATVEFVDFATPQWLVRAAPDACDNCVGMMVVNGEYFDGNPAAEFHYAGPDGLGMEVVFEVSGNYYLDLSLSHFRPGQYMGRFMTVTRDDGSHTIAPIDSLTIRDVRTFAPDDAKWLTCYAEGNCVVEFTKDPDGTVTPDGLGYNLYAGDN
ncbi:MAG: hypothetical protein PHT12_02580 [Patescibacteria group bacterium]|nr:hypothetical protein [Patescibacteria group bacterium]